MTPVPADALSDRELDALLHARLGLEGDPPAYSSDLDALLSPGTVSILEALGAYEVQVGWERIGYFATVYGRMDRSGGIVGSAHGRPSAARAAAEAVAQAARRLR